MNENAKINTKLDQLNKMINIQLQLLKKRILEYSTIISEVNKVYSEICKYKTDIIELNKI